MNVALDAAPWAAHGWWTVAGVRRRLRRCSANRSSCLRIQAGGIAPPGWALRVALLVAYGLIGAALLLVAARAASAGAARCRVAAVGFVLLVASAVAQLLATCRASAAPRSLLGNARGRRCSRSLAVPLLVRLRRAPWR